MWFLVTFKVLKPSRVEICIVLEWIGLVGLEIVILVYTHAGQLIQESSVYGRLARVELADQHIEHLSLIFGLIFLFDESKSTIYSLLFFLYFALVGLFLDFFLVNDKFLAETYGAALMHLHVDLDEELG